MPEMRALAELDRPLSPAIRSGTARPEAMHSPHPASAMSALSLANAEPAAGWELIVCWAANGNAGAVEALAVCADSPDRQLMFLKLLAAELG